LLAWLGILWTTWFVTRDEKNFIVSQLMRVRLNVASISMSNKLDSSNRG
jgi:hypothetical protein